MLTVRVHPFPFRTRQLSSLVPKILGWRRPGKIGKRQHRKEAIVRSLLFLCLFSAFVLRWLLILFLFFHAKLLIRFFLLLSGRRCCSCLPGFSNGRLDVGRRLPLLECALFWYNGVRPLPRRGQLGRGRSLWPVRCLRLCRLDLFWNGARPAGHIFYRINLPLISRWKL